MPVNPAESAVFRVFLDERIERGKQASSELNTQIDTASFKEAVRMAKRFDGLASERMTSDLLERTGRESERLLIRFQKIIRGYPHVDASERNEVYSWYTGTIHGLHEALVKIDESNRFTDKLIEKAEHLLELRDSEIKKLNEEHRAYIEQALNEKNELLRLIEELKKQVDSVHNEYKNKKIKKLSDKEVTKEAEEVKKKSESELYSNDTPPEDTPLFEKPIISDEDIVERSIEDENESV